VISDRIVFRLEHSGCPVGDVHHGPHHSVQEHYIKGQHIPWFTSAPSFGSRGPEPQSEGLPVGPGWRCGCLREQVSDWWSLLPPGPKPSDWSFGVYQVASHLLHVAERQVVFQRPPVSIFLGYFPGWVIENGELDSEWSDDWLLRSDSWPAMSAPPLPTTQPKPGFPSSDWISILREGYDAT
jgi:hypothetical protein